MPRFDGTGPGGIGPGTGWGRGPCGAGYGWRRSVGWGRGLGRFGGGIGWGWPSPYSQPPTSQDELKTLKEESQLLKDGLKAINDRIAGLEQEK